MASPVPINWERRELELPDRLYRSQRILVYALIRALTRYRDFTRDAGKNVDLVFLPEIGNTPGYRDFFAERFVSMLREFFVVILFLCSDG
jgi:hypothetical protein